MGSSKQNRMSFLSRNEFLDRLKIEKRRTDRSNAPLSITLFSVLEKEKNKQKKIQDFLESLKKNTRETDIKGWIDHGVIGVLLPDTDANGVSRYVEKIANGNGDLGYSVITGTYPDNLFHQLLAEEQGPPDLFPINLDESFESHRIH